MSSAAKQSVRMQFLCEKRQLEFREDVPKSLVGPEAIMKPAMNRMFELTLGPIVMKHAGDALDACEDKCSSKGCNRPATSIVATPMSVCFGVLSRVLFPFFFFSYTLFKLDTLC